MNNPKKMWEMLWESVQKKLAFFIRKEEPISFAWTYQTLANGEEVVDKETISYPDITYTYRYNYDDNGNVIGKELI